MKIVVLMAGNSLRFLGEGYTIPKPFIELYNDFTILDYTLSSIKNIQEYDTYFTIRSDCTYAMTKGIEELKRKYKNAHFVYIDGLTRGNLETAFIAISQINCNRNESVLFLDCDNHYEADNLITDIIKKTDDYGYVVCFEPKDNSDKWGFVIQENGIAKDFIEKDKKAYDLGGLPMVGTFFFSSIKLFKMIAELCFVAGIKISGEFFMTQSMERMLHYKIPVFVYKSKKMIPIGTPEDYIKAKNAFMC